MTKNRSIPAGHGPAAALIEGLLCGYDLYRATTEAARRSCAGSRAPSADDVPWLATLHVIAWVLMFTAMAIGGYVA